MALSAPLLSRLNVVQIKEEAAKGTYISPDVDLIAYDLEAEPTADFIERKSGSKALGHANKGVIGARAGVCRFRAALRGNGSNAMDAGITSCLKASGMANASEVYSPTSAIATMKTLSIAAYKGGKVRKLQGAMGNWTLEGDIGQPLYFNFEFMGTWIAPADAALPTWAPNATLPPHLLAATFTLGGESIKISHFELTPNNVVVPRADADNAAGIIYHMITDRDPILTLDPEDDLVAGYAYEANWLAGTTAAVNLVIGSGAGEQITINIPVYQFKEVSPDDREGIATIALTGQCVQSTINTGNDEFTITVATS